MPLLASYPDLPYFALNKGVLIGPGHKYPNHVTTGSQADNELLMRFLIVYSDFITS